MTITQPNFFDILGEKQIVQPVKRKLARLDRRAAAEARKKEEKAEAEQLSLYRAWKRGVRKELQAKHGKQLEDLIKLLKSLSIDSADELVEFVKRADWLIQADEHSKYTVLSYIDDAIIRLRIRHGLSPFDDSIPSFDGTPDEEPPTAFQIIRKLLMVN